MIPPKLLLICWLCIDIMCSSLSLQPEAASLTAWLLALVITCDFDANCSHLALACFLVEDISTVSRSTWISGQPLLLCHDQE
jgi:hypothetical protein